MAYITVVFNDYMPFIWNTLVGAIGNEKGVAGLMGNLYAESGCTPYACQPSRPYNICMTYIGKVDRHEINETGFVNHGTSDTGGVAAGKGGFGLAQWTFPSRKQMLYDYWETQGGSIGDLGMQVRFLIYELNLSYSSVWSVLTTTSTIAAASDIVLEVFENPEDQSADVHDTRQNYGQQIYDAYAGTTPVEPVNPQPSPANPPQPEPQPPLTITQIKKKMPIWMYPTFRK